MDGLNNLLPKLQLTPEEKASFEAARIDCIKRTQQRFSLEILQLGDIISTLKKSKEEDDWCPDILPVQMHNLICIAHDEQYRFLADIKRLLCSLPKEVRQKKEIDHVIKAVSQFSKSDLDNKMVQSTDISMFLTTYRTALYQYGILETRKQLKWESNLRDLIIEAAEFVEKKRRSGLNTANVLARQQAAQ